MFPSSSAPSREYIKRDSAMWWRPGRVYIPANQFTGLVTAALTAGAGSEAFAAGAFMQGSGVGTAIWKEISTTGVVGVAMNTAADEINTQMLLPDDMDISKNIYVRVHWTSGSATTADTIDWIVRYLKIVPNTTAIVSAATVLDKTIAQDTVPVATANTWCATEYGVIQPAVTAFADNVEAIQWEVEMDAFAAGLTEDKFCLGLEIRYTPKRLYYGGMLHEAKAPLSMLSDKYSN